jgi:hypothetical protein
MLDSEMKCGDSQSEVVEMDVVLLILICLGVWKIADAVETVVKEYKLTKKENTDGPNS